MPEAKIRFALNKAVELDDGDPADLATLYQDLKSQLPHLNIFGGCCGTDHRHLEEICKAVVPPGTSRSLRAPFALSMKQKQPVHR